jgi:hypothetical protein
VHLFESRAQLSRLLSPALGLLAPLPPDSRHGQAFPHEAAVRSCGRRKWHDAVVQNGPRAAGRDLEGLVAVCGKVAAEVLQRVLGPARPASLRTDKVVLRERERD